VTEDHLAGNRPHEVCKVRYEVHEQIVNGQHPDHMPPLYQGQPPEGVLGEDPHGFSKVRCRAECDDLGRHHSIDPAICGELPCERPHREVGDRSRFQPACRPRR